MRYLLWFLLIVSLPLRAWVGDSMALDMLHSHPIAIQNIATSAGDVSASGHIHAEMLAGHAGCGDHASAVDTKAHCADGSCSWCQVCHTVAAPAALPVPAPAWVPHVRPQAGSTDYASALAAPALKPPIS